MVCGLAWRCAVSRCVKNRSNKVEKLRSVFMCEPPSSFQPGGGQSHQLRMHRQIPVGIRDMRMAEKRREHGQSPFDVRLRAIPLNQRVDGESMPKIVNPRTGVVGWGPQTRAMRQVV